MLTKSGLITMTVVYHVSHFSARRWLGVCQSVCPSVSDKPALYQTAKHRITQAKPYDNPGTLVFLCQRSQLNSSGVTPNGGAK